MTLARAPFTRVIRRIGDMALVVDGGGERWVNLPANNPVDPADSPLLTPRDPRFGPTPWPDWVTEFRDHQVTAALEIVELFEAGKKVVWLDAPTGSGKSLIGEMVRRLMQTSGLYVCSTKSLQSQFLRDFPYAHVLQGRSNYPTLNLPFPDTTCADCTKTNAMDGCSWCDEVDRCPYQVAKRQAVGSDVAVLNTSYLLAEGNGPRPGQFSGRGLGVLDECDVLERELMGYVQFDVGYRTLQQLGVKEVKKGSHWGTVVGWIEQELRPAVMDEIKKLGGQGRLELGGGNEDLKHVRRVKQMRSLLRDVDAVLRNVAMEGVDEAGNEVEVAGWVRDNAAGPMCLKPITVDGYGEKVLWRHAEKWLCMSGSIISAEALSRDLGVRDGDWGVVTVPMTFARENRRIIQVGVANMIAKEKEVEWPKMCKGVEAVVKRHVGERVLVHAVSYDLMNAIAGHLRATTDREIVTYQNAGQRDEAVVRYRATEGAVLVAPSMDRGVDFKDEDCRVVVVAKVPYPYLGDVQVGKRMRVKGGEMWYSVQTVRTIVQMTGRGVRSEADYAVSYILDKQFAGNVMKRSSRLLPRWWRDALEVERPKGLGL